jgi:multiple sugar transport system ATP-binding protein
MDLKLEGLSKRFDGRVAVEIPELAVRHREFFTFVGPSGCGKSTTLNMIAGLEDPDTGKLWLGERCLNDLPPHKRDIAFVFQTYALYPHRTVFGNLAFPLELAGLSRQAVRERVHEAASLLGLDHLLEKTPRQLSGGERQRVALGRAIVRQPVLFLFDEPLSNLDAPLRAQMRRELKSLHQRIGTTFIYVTHDQEEALSLSDRIAVMKLGRIQQCGTPREVYDRPENVFVASFFGSPPMNLINASDDAARDSLPGAENALRSAGLDLGPGKNESLVIGIRPEHIRISPEPTDPGIPAKIAAMALHGGQTHVELDIEGLRLISLESTETGCRPGQKVWIRILQDRWHLFDRKSGMRQPTPQR